MSQLIRCQDVYIKMEKKLKYLINSKVKHTLGNRIIR